MATYIAPFALLRNPHRALFSCFGFPSRNLRMYAKTKSRFYFLICYKPAAFRACGVFFCLYQTLSFVQMEQKYLIVQVILHNHHDRLTQKIAMANKQASGETTVMSWTEHRAPIIPLYCERTQAVSSSTGWYSSLFTLSLGKLPRQPICLCWPAFGTIGGA